MIFNFGFSFLLSTFLHLLNCHYKMIASLINHIQQLKVEKNINKLPFEVWRGRGCFLMIKFLLDLLAKVTNLVFSIKFVGLTIRLLSSTQQNSRKVDKSLLSRLRKETGFGFAKCMEGLQASNNDYDTALTWLKAEAEKQGWEKAAKLQGRAAAEGLVGVLVDGNFGAMVEVGYETLTCLKNNASFAWIFFFLL